MWCAASSPRTGQRSRGSRTSVADAVHVRRTLEAFPDLDVFVGNEIFLPEALALGAAGAISGLGNVAPRQMAFLAANASRGEATFEAMARALTPQSADTR